MPNEELNQPKEIAQILHEQIETSLHEHRRPRFSLLLSSFSAGLEVGFSLLLMATAYSMFAANNSENFTHVLISICYPLGFLFVVIGRSELFTEHTTLAIFPVLNGNETVKNLFILWGIIYFGNILGGCLFSYLAVYVGQEMRFIKAETFYELAHKLTDFKWHAILISGIFAGWLMGLLAWLIASVNETISRIFMVIMVTFVIGFFGLHHSIVGNIELFAGFISSEKITFSLYIKTLALASFGNLLGGVIFVALLKFSHVKQSIE
ncbi:MAG: formate/nitrite transporter family protein [Pelobium sp.]